MAENIGLNLRAVREERKLSLRDVESRSKGRVKASHLSQVETTRVKEPSLSMLRALAPVYGLTFRELLVLLDMIEEPDDEADERRLLLLSVSRDFDDTAYEAAVPFMQHLALESRKRQEG